MVDKVFLGFKIRMLLMIDGLSAAETSVCLPEGLVVHMTLSGLVRGFGCSFLLVYRDRSTYSSSTLGGDAAALNKSSTSPEVFLGAI